MYLRIYCWHALVFKKSSHLTSTLLFRPSDESDYSPDESVIASRRTSTPRALPESRDVLFLTSMSRIPIMIESALWHGVALVINILLDEFVRGLLSLLDVVLRALYWALWIPIVVIAPKAFRTQHMSTGGYDLACIQAASRVVVIMCATVLFGLSMDYSVVYHYLRQQGLLKLYIMFNMLEVLERLVRSFGYSLGDDLTSVVLELSDAWKRFGVVTGTEGDGDGPESSRECRFRTVVKTLAVLGVNIGFTWCHSILHFVRILLLATAIVAPDASLALVLITNSFTEIKSVVFKKHDWNSLYVIVASDVVERAYLVLDTVAILFMLGTSSSNGLASGIVGVAHVAYWLMILWVAEIATDWIKFLCVAKFSKIDASFFRATQDMHCQDFLSSEPRYSDRGTEKRSDRDDDDLMKSNRTSTRDTKKANSLSGVGSPSLSGSPLVSRLRYCPFSWCTVLLSVFVFPPWKSRLIKGVESVLSETPQSLSSAMLQAEPVKGSWMHRLVFSPSAVYHLTCVLCLVVCRFVLTMLVRWASKPRTVNQVEPSVSDWSPRSKACVLTNAHAL